MSAHNTAGEPQWWIDAQGNRYSLHPWQLQAPIGDSFNWENTGCPPRQGVNVVGTNWPPNGSPAPGPYYSWSTTYGGTSVQPVDLTQVKIQIAVTDKRKKLSMKIVEVSVQDMLNHLTPAMQRKIIQKVALEKALEQL